MSQVMNAPSKYFLKPRVSSRYRERYFSCLVAMQHLIPRERSRLTVSKTSLSVLFSLVNQYSSNFSTPFPQFHLSRWGEIFSFKSARPKVHSRKSVRKNSSTDSCEILYSLAKRSL